MATSEDWLADALDESLQDDRRQAEHVLSHGQTQFRKLLVPESIGPTDELNKLLNRFDQPTLEALINLFFDLHRALFERPEAFFRGGETNRLYMIQLLPTPRIQELGQYVGKLFDPADEIFPSEISEVSGFFAEWLKATALAIGYGDEFDSSPSETSARSRWRDELKKIARRFDENLNAGHAADVAVEAAERATRAAVNAETAAGETAQSALGKHFNDIANRERRWALGWTVVTILVVVAVVSIGLQIVSAAVTQDWLKSVFHLVLVLPILGLASYTATIAKGHRQLERWATTAYVQIRTVGAYSNLLPNTGISREQLVMDLGQNIFATPVFGDTKSERISTVPADLLDALKETAKALASKAKE